MAKRNVGRPTKLSGAVKEEILERISLGETLTQICLSEHIPARQNVYKLIRRDKEFRDAYAISRELQMHSWMDEIIDIADDNSIDFFIVRGADGRPVLRPNSAAIRRDRLRVDTRKFLMAKIAARCFERRLKGNETPLEDLPQVITLESPEAPEITTGSKELH